MPVAYHGVGRQRRSAARQWLLHSELLMASVNRMLIAPWLATAALAGSPPVTGEARLHGFVLPALEARPPWSMSSTPTWCCILGARPNEAQMSYVHLRDHRETETRPSCYFLASVCAVTEISCRTARNRA